MPTQSYSHNNEDILLDKIFADIDDGFYVDVGAFLPIQSSNTYALYQRGWSGIVIDPLIEDHYKEWAKHRERDFIYPFAVASTNRKIDFWKCNSRQLSTGVIDYWHAGAEKAKIGEPAEVWANTLDYILALPPPPVVIHLLAIDVEGMEGEVLAGLDLSKWRPWVMLIEAAPPGKSRTYQPLLEWEPRLLDNGYRFFHDDGSNRWYVAAEHRDLVK